MLNALKNTANKAAKSISNKVNNKIEKMKHEDEELHLNIEVNYDKYSKESISITIKPSATILELKAKICEFKTKQPLKSFALDLAFNGSTLKNSDVIKDLNIKNEDALTIQVGQINTKTISNKSGVDEALLKAFDKAVKSRNVADVTKLLKNANPDPESVPGIPLYNNGYYLHAMISVGAHARNSAEKSHTYGHNMYANCLEIATLLLNNKASLSRTQNDKTPLELAKEKKCDGFIKLLESYLATQSNVKVPTKGWK